MAFIEQRLPEDVERGAVGGPGFKTTVITLSSGFEKRNIDWERTRGRWDIGYGLTRRSQLEEVINHFYVMNGRANGFRFKDWSDFQIGDTDDDSTRQDIGLGDDSTTEFQVYKRYSVGPFSYDRVINKLVSGSLTVFLDGVEQTVTTDYTVDLNTGIITFTTAPASTGGTGSGGEEVVSVICEFDVPVRFESDELPITTEIFSSEAIVSMSRIGIMEIRV